MAGITRLLFIFAVFGTEILCLTLNDPCNSTSHAVIYDPHGYRASGRRYNVTLCDDSLPDQWYRVESAAGDLMVRQCVSHGECGTRNPVWMNGSIPGPDDGVVSRDVCLTFGDSCCYKRNRIQVRNCGTYMLYKLPPTGFCASAYCFRGHGDRNYSMTPSSNSSVWTGQNKTQPWMSRNTTGLPWGRQNTTLDWAWKNTTELPWGRQNTTLDWAWKNTTELPWGRQNTILHWPRKNTTELPWGRQNTTLHWVRKNTTSFPWDRNATLPWARKNITSFPWDRNLTLPWARKNTTSFPWDRNLTLPWARKNTTSFPWDRNATLPWSWNRTTKLPWAQENFTPPRGSPSASPVRPGRVTDPTLVSDGNADLVKLTDKLKGIETWVAVGAICCVLLVASLVGVILWQHRRRFVADTPGKYTTFKV